MLLLKIRFKRKNNENESNILGTEGNYNRGCLKLSNLNVLQACTQANNGVTPLMCQLCTSNQCNSSSNLTASYIILSFGFIAALLSKRS